MEDQKFGSVDFGQMKGVGEGIIGILGKIGAEQDFFKHRLDLLP
jgi:hypothetical protein